MRPILAAALTTALPMLVGQPWITGAPIVRWSLGAVVGIVLLALGALFGGLLGNPTAGAALLLLVGWLAAPRFRWDAGRDAFAPEVNRLFILLVGVGLALMAMSWFRPVAGWDGWFQWSLKSKGLASTGSFHSPVFVSPAYSWSSQDFPTLLPSWQAIGYIVSGDLTASWVLQFQQAWLWTAGSIALTALTGAYLGRACLLLLAWVLTPQVLWQSMQGYADIPMALFLLIGTIVLRKERSSARAHALAGLLLAGAALTKAEGTALVGIVLVCLLATRRPTPILALAPVIVIAARLPWWLFTRAHGLTNEHVVSLSAYVTSLASGEVHVRLPEIGAAMLLEMFVPFRWGLLLPGCVAVAWVARRLDGRLAAAGLLQLALFAAVYEVTWSHQGMLLEAFMGMNAHRVLMAPLGVIALAVGLGAARRDGLPDVRATIAPQVT